MKTLPLLISASRLSLLLCLSACSTASFGLPQWIPSSSPSSATEASQPTDPASVSIARLNKAAALSFERGDIQGASNLYRQSLKERPENPEALRGMAEILEKAGALDAAAESCDAALKLDAGDRAALRILARVRLAQKRLAEAQQLYEEVLEHDKGDVKSLIGLGVIHDQLGKHEKAQQMYLAAIQRDTGNIAALNNLGYSYILSNEPAKAVALYEPRLGHPGMTPAIRQNLALAYGLAGDDKNAERIAKMDLSAKQVSENLAYYRQKRAEMVSSGPAPVILGPFPTEAIAQPRLALAQKELAEQPVRLTLVPEVATPNGTPRFVVQVTSTDAQNPVTREGICPLVAKINIPCGQ